jgi:hypothetical protein
VFHLSFFFGCSLLLTVHTMMQMTS